ncbi:MAG TPA: hypothetical protein VFX73_03740, partial [Chitinophagaceae bacterium]|nr:hypothetical protein [Chitinophagaceae bacterium]
MKFSRHIFCFLVFLNGGIVTGTAQSLPVGTPVFEDLYRIMQLKGERDSSTSFLVRPMHAAKTKEFDSLYHPYGLLYKHSRGSDGHFFKDKGKFYALPLTLNQQYNTHHPYGWNDGAMIPAKGYQALFSAGVYASVGWLSVQLRPEFVFAENRDFAEFPVAHTDSVWKHYYGFLNSIDNPEKFGQGAYTKLFP